MGGKRRDFRLTALLAASAKLRGLPGSTLDASSASLPAAWGRGRQRERRGRNARSQPLRVERRVRRREGRRRRFLRVWGGGERGRGSEKVAGDEAAGERSNNKLHGSGLSLSHSRPRRPRDLTNQGWPRPPTPTFGWRNAPREASLVGGRIFSLLSIASIKHFFFRSFCTGIRLSLLMFFLGKKTDSCDQSTLYSNLLSGGRAGAPKFFFDVFQITAGAILLLRYFEHIQSASIRGE